MEHTVDSATAWPMRVRCASLRSRVAARVPARPVDFASPSEGVLALEQVLNVTPGSKVKELAFAYIDYMLRPDVQKLLAEGVWYSPSNKKVKLDAKYDAKLLTTEAKVATLIQPDWKWYNARKEDIDARVTKILKG